MDRSTKSYLLVHYTLLIALILLIAAAIERFTGSTPFWLGLLIAVLVGILYPRFVAAAGVAPESWER